MLRAGAQDYIAKDGLTPLALTRILENARERLTMARELLARNVALQRTERFREHCVHRCALRWIRIGAAVESC